MSVNTYTVYESETETQEQCWPYTSLLLDSDLDTVCCLSFKGHSLLETRKKISSDCMNWFFFALTGKLSGCCSDSKTQPVWNSFTVLNSFCSVASLWHRWLRVCIDLGSSCLSPVRIYRNHDVCFVCLTVYCRPSGLQFSVYILMRIVAFLFCLLWWRRWVEKERSRSFCQMNAQFLLLFFMALVSLWNALQLYIFWTFSVQYMMCPSPKKKLFY